MMIRKLREKIHDVIRKSSIRATIAITFSVVSIVCLLFLGVTLYLLFSSRVEKLAIENAEELLNQTSVNLEAYLRNMRLVSDTMYYSSIKETDLETETLDSDMNLLYEANKDNLINIACFYNDGTLVSSFPYSSTKTNVNIPNQGWFSNALGEMENSHFSTPHVQNLFDTTSSRYYWVVSLSRAVELNTGGRDTLGVLLIDMNYSSIKELFDRVNEDISTGYVYLMSSDGNIIYHPRQNLIYSGLAEENNYDTVNYKDGTRLEEFMGEKRFVSVKTVSYTGWKIVNVTPYRSMEFGYTKTPYYVAMIISTITLLVLFLSRALSLSITRPLLRLTESISVTEDGTLNPDIYIGGNSDVEYLGRTLKDVVDRLRKLTDDIVIKTEEKRRSELDALQSQINPHFLYNTLDSIIWMIEGEQYDDAVFMVSELASLFRISLSKGKTIIALEDEVRHAQNYMNIQKVRYKDKFDVDFDIDPSLNRVATVKLVIQPILENAIYYGVESLDGDGKIDVCGRRDGDDVYISIKDNGLGMCEEEVEKILSPDEKHVKKRGSGVGLINVHNRIQLRFGKEYGLIVESEPDVGTCVTIHIPFKEIVEEAKPDEVK